MYSKIILTHIIPEGSKLVNQTERISENYNTQNQTALVTESDFNLVFQQNYSVILNYAQYLLGDRDVALDVTQETFIRFYNNKPAHDNVVGWLKKVAANLSYNYMREKKVRYNKDSEIYLQMQETIIVVEEKVIDNIEILKVRALLKKMKPRDRMCLLLKYSGYKYEEIAEILNINKNAVGTVIARALKSFKKIYDKEW